MTGSKPQSDSFKKLQAEKKRQLRPAVKQLVEHVWPQSVEEQKMTDPMAEDSLEAVYVKVRAGKDPDTGALHMSESEFKAAINAYTTNKIIEARKDELHKLGESFLTEKGLMWCISRMQELRDEALNHRKER